jgi:hypothetical protein
VVFQMKCQRRWVLGGFFCLAELVGVYGWCPRRARNNACQPASEKRGQYLFGYARGLEARRLLFGLLVGLGIKFPIFGARKHLWNTKLQSLNIIESTSSTLFFGHRVLLPYGKS